MANRRFYQFGGTLVKKPVTIYGKFTVGASGVPTLVAENSPGVSSVVRTAAGDYRITLQDKYNAFLGESVSLVSSTLQNIGFQVKAETVRSAGIVDLYCFNAAVPAGRMAYTGITEVQTLTAQAKASCVDGDYIWFYDNLARRWAVAIDLTGSSAEPTGANWVATDASRRVQADISGDTTAADVMATIEAALATLTGFSDKFTTDDSAADGTMTLTWDDRRYQAALADPQQDDDAGAGTSITAASTTDGRDGCVSIADDTFEVPGHGFPLAAPIVITGSNGVPTGITAGTTYYVIPSTANTFQVATSAANAVAGTQVNITADASADGFLEFATTSAGVDPASGSTIHFELRMQNHAD